MPAGWTALVVLSLGAAAEPPKAASAAAPPALVAPTGQKNIVLIVADDLGLQLGCYGDRVVRTPHLDQLAAEGTRFTRAFCTTASCSASRSVILTGQQNHANGQYGHAHSFHHFSSFDEVISLPVALSASGYRTCSIGKFHVAPEKVYHFSRYENQGILGARSSVRMAENARRFIEEHDRRPFFLYFCSSDPHRAGKPGDFDNFSVNPAHYPGVTPVVYKPEEIPVPPWLPDEPEVRQELAEYYQAISRLDQGVGKLLESLKETGHWDDTLIIFLSDNGPPFPGAKTTVYEPGVRLPLLVRHPGQQKKGVVTEAMVSWADIMPTILEFSGIRVPVRYVSHGRSLLPVLQQERPAGWEEVFGSHTFHEITMYYPMRWIRTGKYKFIWNVAHGLTFPSASDLQESLAWEGFLARQKEPGADKLFGKRTMEAYLQRPKFELYDLEADPDEIKNLAADPQQADLVVECQAKLRALQAKTRDPWGSKWKYE